MITAGVLIFSNLSAKETLTWQVVHWPPFQMLEGVDKGHGRFDALLALYQANLPQYEHKTIQMNWARFWNEIRDGKEICSIFAIRTDERSSYTAFSKPLSMGLPLKIIMRESSIDALGKPDAISIVNLLEDKKFKGIFISKRSYYSTIDTILEQHSSLSTFKTLAIPDENVIRMILSGRADYTLEYSYLANYLASKLQTEYDAKIGSIAVKENLPYGQSCLACPKNGWGKKVVKDFDFMLERIKLQPEYLKIMQMYHTDPKELEEIKQQFTKIILKAE